MQRDKKNIDDLDYLSQLGFEEVAVTDVDMKELQSKIKSRVFSYNNGFYFAFVSLIVGVFIGVSFFFMINNRTQVFSSNFPNKILTENIPAKKNVAETLLNLDTITITNENFINPNIKNPLLNDSTTLRIINQEMDSAIQKPSKPINFSTVIITPVSESKIKYISNAPITYIQDLKVTNYAALYFKKNQYIKLPVKGGLPVSYANKEDYVNTRSGLKQSADYFLHEELSEALLSFKKGNYKQSIYALNVISSYNSEDINCNFYLGMSYYQTKNYIKALDYFERCIENANNTFLQEALYYQAVCLNESGNTEKASKLFKSIAEEGEFYSEKAKGYLRK